MEQTFKCSQCGMDFPASDIITYENHYVCSGCKPLFVQRLREGVNLSATTHFGGFWIRVGAKMIDYIILWVVNWIVALLIYKTFPNPAHSDPKHLALGFKLIPS